MLVYIIFMIDKNTRIADEKVHGNLVSIFGSSKVKLITKITKYILLHSCMGYVLNAFEIFRIQRCREYLQSFSTCLVLIHLGEETSVIFRLCREPYKSP